MANIGGKATKKGKDLKIIVRRHARNARRSAARVEKVYETALRQEGKKEAQALGDEG